MYMLAHKQTCHIHCSLLEVPKLLVFRAWVTCIHLLHIVSREPLLLAATIVPPPPASLVLLHISDDSILAEGELISTSLVVVIQGSHHTWQGLLVLEGEIHRVVIDRVVIWVLWGREGRERKRERKEKGGKEGGEVEGKGR